MKQIHHVAVSHQDRYVLDPALGAVKRREEVLAPSSVDRVVHEGDTFEAENGSFNVPDELASFLLAQPGWHEGPSPFEDDDEAEAKPAAKPRARSSRKPS